MSSNRNENRLGLFSWLVGVSAGAAVGAALGMAYVFTKKREVSPTIPKKRSPARPPTSQSFTRAQLPKRHFKYLFTKQKLLSAEYREYLTEIFKLADSDNDGGLTEDDLQNLAVIVKNEPIGPHQIDWFFETFETNEQGNLTLSGFLKSYEWPLTVDLPLEEIKHSYEVELGHFGCTMDSWMEP